MKQLFITGFIAALGFTMHAQEIQDTVSLGASYTNQKWYSLENGEQATSPKNNWDIAFDVSGGFATSIHINSATGTTLWTYPNGNISAWASVDTSGMTTWTAQYNSDETWSIGAFDANITSNPNDVGWGIYSSITHVITGDSLFIIKLANGDFKKVWIVNVAGGGYNFKYANINGTSEQTYFLNKSTYPGKNFAYYSLQNDSALDREPASSSWDLLFGQYTTFIPTPYVVSGVLSNKGVEVAQVDNVASPSTYNDWFPQTYSTNISTLGSDWKVFDMNTYLYNITQDTVYFIKSKAGNIWKLRFKGFGGGSNGNFIFTKEQLSTVGLEELGETTAKMSVYPNPSATGTVTLVYDIIQEYNKVSYVVYDQFGKVVLSEQLNSTTGLYTHTISTSELSVGIYTIAINLDNNAIQQKLIIQ
jgi:hypothetical protein